VADEVIKIRVDAETEKAAKQLNYIKTALKAAFGAFSVAMIANYIVKFTRLIDKITDFQDKIAKASKATGIAVKSLSSLGFVAERSGASLDAVTIGLRTMIKRAADASYGLKTAERSFEQLGIQVTDANGNLKEGNALLLEIAESFKRETDATKKAALAQEIFGRSGLDLIPMLNEGKEGIEALQKRAEELGITFDEKTAAKAEEFRDRVTDLNTALNGLKFQLVTNVTPALVEMFETMTTGITDVKKFYDQVSEVLTLRLLGKDVKIVSVLKEALQNMARGEDITHALQFALFETIEGIDLLDEKLGKIAGKDGSTPSPLPDPTDTQAKQDALKKAFIEELEWIEKTNKKNKDSAEMWREYNVERLNEAFQARKELYENADKYLTEYHDKEMEQMQERAEMAYKTAQAEIEAYEKVLQEQQRIAEAKVETAQFVTGKFAEAFSYFKDESKTAFEAYKIFATAETLISTYEAAQKSFAAMAGIPIIGPALGTVAAVAAVAAGLARVAAISSQNYEPRAQGGNVQAGTPYIIGERGREMFVPDISGYIIPNNVLKKLGGKTTVINVNAMDVQSFRDFLRRGGANVLESEVSKGRLF